MAARPIWKGQIRLSLVSIPVEVYSARNSGGRPSFRQIHQPTGKPVRYEKTVPGVGPVEADEIVKGYDTGEGEWILIEPEEIDAIRLETKKTLDLVQFVDACEIPPLYFDKPYYIVPTDELAEEAYRVLRDALRQSGKAGLGQMAMRGREYLAALRPCGDGLLLETLHYPDEIRKAEPLFASIQDEEADPELLDLATSLIERKTARFDASAYEDRYAAALRDLIARKRKSGKAPRVEREEGGRRPQGENVVDLMGALKESLKEDGGKGGRGKSKSSGGKSGQKGGGRRKAS
ncbi:MAG: Ku protein [Rhodosalinus sp.]